MRMIQLEEVEVTAPRIEKKEEARLQFWANAKSDATIRRDVIEKHSFCHVADYLRLIPGVDAKVQPMSGEARIEIRGLIHVQPKYIPPLIIVDGVPFGGESDSPGLEDIPVDIIESIDVFKGPSTAVFGGRGGTGVISITTRRASENRNIENENEPNSILYKPLGYQKPAEFYSPRYETLESRQMTVPDYRTTIYWKPDVVISNDGKASFEFYTADFPTTYSVVIEGLTADGKIVRQVEKIKVK